MFSWRLAATDRAHGAVAIAAAVVAWRLAVMDPALVVAVTVAAAAM